MFKRYALTSIALLSLVLSAASPAYATDANAQSRGASDPYTTNVYLEGSVTPDLSTPYSNATTGYTDVTGASVAVPAWPGGISGGTDQTQTFLVCYSIQGSKATTLTGSVGIYVNGALDPDTVLTGGFAVLTATGLSQTSAGVSLGGCFMIAPTVATAQTIKLQAKSADTAAFTITQASLIVFRIR